MNKLNLSLALILLLLIGCKPTQTCQNNTITNITYKTTYNTTIKEDMKRLETLKDLDQRAYVMRYDKCRGKRIYNDLASWANQPQFFMKYPFEKYCELRHNHM